MKRQKQQVASKPDEPKSESYSTRFDAKQRELIEQAAAIAGCSPAKLIREATVRRAADIVNSEEGVQLRALATSFLAPVLKPTVVLECYSGHGEIEENTWEYTTHHQWSADDVKLGDEVSDVLGGKVEVPDYRVRAQIKTAMKACGSRFVEILLEQWAAIERGGTEYKPKVNADELLDGKGD